MTRDIRNDYDLTAFSCNAAEAALNAGATLDTTMLMQRDKILFLRPQRETNENEATGYEETTKTYDRGKLSDGNPSPPIAMAQYFAFFYGYAYGSSSPASWGTGYKHTIVPRAPRDMPSFSGACRLGNSILKRKFDGLFMDSVNSKFSISDDGKPQWAEISANIKGTGKYTDNVVEESVTANYNATSLTLAANAVQGASAAERLDSIHNIQVLVPATGEWKDVVATVVSDAEPAELTIEAPGVAATSTTYKVLYVPEEAAWCTFPSRIIEPPLMSANMIVNVGGKWDGSAILGGHVITEEIRSIEHTLNVNMSVEHRAGGNGLYANFAQRKGFKQALKLNKEARDYFLENKMLKNEDILVYLTAVGPEFETGKNYFVSMLFPQCSILEKPYTFDNKIICEEGNLEIQADPTYGSAIIVVGNKVAAYAA